MRWLPLAALLAAPLAAAGCATPAPDDVVGPFTGPVHRYVVDRFAIPENHDAALAMGDDLDGDGMTDNEMGTIIGTLSQQGDVTTHGADMIASGVIASSLEIQADDLANDPTVAVRYFGSDADAPVAVAGTLEAGVFRSNRTATTGAPGRASVLLPVFADADPSAFAIDGLEIDLVPDGAGGYDATLRGGIPAALAQAAADRGIAQMIAQRPQDHLPLIGVLDTNEDGQVSEDEIAHAPLLESLLAPDIQLFDGDRYAPTPHGEHPDALSAGFSVHLAPCDAGRCASAPPADTCFDRVLDGDETGLDCGGGCTPCPAGAACAGPDDCQSGACDAGFCRAP